VQRLLAVAAAVCVGVLPAAQAHAAPSVSDVEAQINKQWAQLEPVIEQYNQVHTQLQANQKKTADLQRKIQPLSLQADLALNRIGGVAARYYMTGPSSDLNALLETGQPTTLADQLTILDQLARQERKQIETVVAARDAYNGEKVKLDAVIAQQAKQDAELAAKKKQIDAEISRLQQLRLTVYGSTTSGGSLRKGPCPAIYVGGKAGIAVRTACAQIGKPYVWAASGPDAFDCSGLTMYAWQAAGVWLSHYTGAQWNQGTPVSRSAAQPGDLVFFFDDLHHMGMYVGNGLMVHAPTPGEPIRMEYIDNIDNGRVAGFRRPG
jgi:cell wall-associated NlpC family hydrolase